MWRLDISETKIRGNVSELPPHVVDLNLSGNKYIVIGLGNLPKSVTRLNLSSCEQTTGSLESLAGMMLTKLDLSGCRRVTGDRDAFEQQHHRVCNCNF